MKAIIIALTMFMTLNTNHDTALRYDTALVTSNYYSEEDACNIMCVTDSHGNDWIMYDEYAPLGSECIIQYDTHDTNDIYDDEITNIVYFHDAVERLNPTSEPSPYIVSARYYTCGEVVTTDGHVYEYSTDTISDKSSYDGEPVFAVFSDNGTPNYLEDDEVRGLVLDMATEIYDKLEDELSKEFTVERNGNELCVSQQ